MKNKILIFLSSLLLCGSLYGQTITVSPATQYPTIGSYQTITAIVQGLNNKTVTWAITSGPGTLAGTNPSAENGPATISLHSTTTGTTVVTATASNGTTVGSSTIHFISQPTPVTTHPRLLLTPSIVTSLQAKAISGNPMYQQGFLTPAISYYTQDNSVFNWTCNGGNGQPSVSRYGFFLEVHAYYYAYMALVDPSDPTYNWKCYAHDVGLYVMNAVITDQHDNFHGNEWSQSSLYFATMGDWMLASGAISSATDKATLYSFCAFALQWLQISPGGADYGSATPSYNNTTWNATTQFNTGTNTDLIYQRGMGSNYVWSKNLLLVGLSQTFNDLIGEDPNITTGGAVAIAINAPGTSWAVGDTFHAIASGTQLTGTITAISGGGATGPAAAIVVTSSGTNFTSATTYSTTAVGPSTGTGLTIVVTAGNTCGATRYNLCSDYSGGSLHAFFHYWTGTYLLKEWAHLDDPAVITAAYNAAYSFGSSPVTCLYTDGTSYTCYGDSRNGDYAEGSGYGPHIADMRYTLNMLLTAGLNDPLTYGPQVSLTTSSFWDQLLQNDIMFLTGFGPQTNSSGPSFNYLSTGDMDTYITEPSYYQEEVANLSFDFYNGRTDENNAILWLILNSAWGGPKGTTGPLSCAPYCGYVNELHTDFAGLTALDMMITQPASDPTAGTLPTDPRSSYPTQTFSNSYTQRQMTRTSYATTGSFVSFFGNNALIDHEYEYKGGIDVVSNNEYITKPLTTFTDYNYYRNIGLLQNIETIYNTGTGSCSSGTGIFSTTNGGQFWHNDQADLSFATHSELPTYSSMSVNTTPVYNGCFISGAPWPTPGYDLVTAASRDEIYLIGSNQIVVYDRMATGSNSLDKAVSYISTGALTISGNSATWPTRSTTQKAKVTALLPASPTITSQNVIQYVTTNAPFANLHNGSTMQMQLIAQLGSGGTQDYAPTATWTSDTPSVATVNSAGLVTAVAVGTATITGQIGGYSNFGIVTVITGSSSGTWSPHDPDTVSNLDWEPYSALNIDAGSVTSTNALTTLEWLPTASTFTTPTLVQSSSGQNFDGTKIGSALVMFMRAPAALTGTTFPASSATNVYVEDLSPGSVYPVTATGGPATCTADEGGVCNFSVAGTGNVVLGAGTPPIFINSLGTLTSLGTSSILH